MPLVLHLKHRLVAGEQQDVGHGQPHTEQHHDGDGPTPEALLGVAELQVDDEPDGEHRDPKTAGDGAVAGQIVASRAPDLNDPPLSTS